MFQFGGGPHGTEAVEKESFGRGVPRAFAQSGGKKPFVPFKKKKAPMRFGNAPQSDGLDMDAILGRGK